MITGWQTYKIRDLVTDYIGGGWGNDEVNDEFTEPGYVIRGTDIPPLKSGIINHEVYRYHKPSNLRSRVLQAGDIVFEVSGGSTGQPLGRNVLITDSILARFGEPVMCASFCKLIRPNREVVEPDFLQRIFDYLLHIEQIQQFEVQSTGISNYQFEDFLDYQKISLPTTILQRRITAVLGRYDALLDNYQRQVMALEGLAQEVYREWFMRGRCPGAEAGPAGELPAGWRAGKLFDVATITYGFPFDSSFFNEEQDGTPVVRIRDVVDSITKTYTPEEAADKYVLQNGDIIVGMDGEFHINKWTGGRAYLNQRVLRASPKENIPRYFLLFAIRPPIEFLNSIIVGTTVAHLGDADLRRVEVIVPDAESLVKFGKLTDPIYDKVLNLHQQISALRATRDALLPRLLSGQLTVHAAEAILAA